VKFKGWPLFAFLLLTSLSSAQVFKVTDLGANVGATSINDYGQVTENRLAPDGVTVQVAFGERKMDSNCSPNCRERQVPTP